MVVAIIFVRFNAEIIILLKHYGEDPIREAFAYSKHRGIGESLI